MASLTLALSPSLKPFSSEIKKTRLASFSTRPSFAHFSCSCSPSQLQCNSKFPSFPLLKAYRDRISCTALQCHPQLRETEENTSKKLLFFSLTWLAISLACLALPGLSHAADSPIKASGFGLKVASALRKFGLPDEAVVFTLGTLPVLELRGAIPVGYWMQLDPLRLTILSILGNMVPVPFIILYLKRFASFLSEKIPSSRGIFDFLFERAKEKAEPVREFQWIGLMLFVAVPFPGTGAWTGAIVASVLGMSFWPAFWANFFGVVIAGVLVNLLMNLGLKYAIGMGFVLFLVSTVMWSVLRSVTGSFKAN
ncbi:hypothetical protein LUZ61_009242 [Rhynchospora tenuis]|uniref:Small multi-drug export n=1 Tax=Rhynchospora tenuis TaxID=198213 RepID=A0AAD6EY56_9POAL|nr:hypothetical protein LUZ61_009242 [Rhynchospora tenuis]